MGQIHGTRRFGFRGALIVLVALGLAPSCIIMRELGIGGDDPEWVGQEFVGIPQADVVRIVAHEIERRGFELQTEDRYGGFVESRWSYDHDMLSHRGVRERVVAEMERQDDEAVELRIRVQVERNEEIGRFYEEDGDWRPADDNVIVAKELLRHISIVLADYMPEEQVGG